MLTAGVLADDVAQEAFYGLLKRWRTVSTYDLPTPTGRRRARALADAAPAVVLHFWDDRLGAEIADLRTVTAATGDASPAPAHTVGSRSSSRRGDGVSARPIRVVCAHTGMEL